MCSGENAWMHDELERRLNEWLERTVRARYAWTGHVEDLLQVGRLAIAGEIREHGRLPADLLRRYALRRAHCRIRDELRRLRRQGKIPERPETPETRPLAGRITIRLSEATLNALAARAAQAGTRISSIARRVLEDALGL